MSLSEPKAPGNQVNWIPKWQVPQNRDVAYGLLHLWQDIRGRRKSVKEKPAKILMKSKRSSVIDLRHWVSVPSGDTWQCWHTFLVVIAVVWYFEHTQKSPPIIHALMLTPIPPWAQVGPVTCFWPTTEQSWWTVTPVSWVSSPMIPSQPWSEGISLAGFEEAGCYHE